MYLSIHTASQHDARLCFSLVGIYKQKILVTLVKFENFTGDSTACPLPSLLKRQERMKEQLWFLTLLKCSLLWTCHPSQQLTLLMSSSSALTSQPRQVRGSKLHLTVMKPKTISQRSHSTLTELTFVLQVKGQWPRKTSIQAHNASFPTTFKSTKLFCP